MSLRSQFATVRKPRKIVNFIPKVSLVIGDWYKCHFSNEKHKKPSFDFKKLM